MIDAKVALVHDWFPVRRGGEKVFEVFAELFPEASLYALFHFKNSQIEALEKRNIQTSFIQRLPFLKKKFRHYLPLFPQAIERFDFQEYDLIISSSHCVAKGAIPKPDALHVCYIHSPVRYAWNQYFSYFAPQRLGVFSRYIIPPIIHYLRMWDIASNHRVDHFIANSKAVAQRVRRYYNREADVIHPPVDTDFFTPGDKQEDFYLVVSALVPYKRIDLAIQAFNRNGKLLKIVGQGPEYKTLKKMAGPNIRFLGHQDDKSLLALYQSAKAMIMPGEEDFGINSLESQACGVPVIAFGQGGATETVIPEKTGLQFQDLTPQSIIEAVDNFETITFNKKSMRANALGYSREAFREKIASYIQEKWETHRAES
jgi:glycosyltransferase involved in cell wall biosynthesis